MSEDPKEKSPTFRKSSLEHLNAPEQLDQLFLPIMPRYWLAWIALGVLGIFLVLWLFFGSIPIIVEGRGIVMNVQGLFSIDTKTTGIVTKILIAPGNKVSKGQLLLIIEDPQVIAQYENALAEEKKISEELFELQAQISTESQAEKEALQKLIDANQFAIIELEKRIPSWESELQKKERLYEQKLIGLNDVQVIREVLTQIKIELETTKATIATLEANLSKMYRYQELKNKERILLQAKQKVEILKLTLDYGNVYSHDQGIALEILVNEGDRVTPGTVLMHLEYMNQPSRHLLYGYVPLPEGKKIQQGTRAHIEPSTVNPQEYGSLVGTVEEVSSFAVSKEKIEKLIKNESLVNYLLHGSNAVTQLIISPVLDPKTPTGYKWTSGVGPPIQITEGTVCKITIIADRSNPLFYFFSLWRVEKMRKYFESFWQHESVKP